jgi:RHS repeat-associated protein
VYRFTDIESPPPGPASSVIPQFEYDEIGNLVGDHINNLSISWNNYGKIDHILNTQNNSSIYFTYDPMGNRVRKINYSDDSNKSDYTATYYVHDAQGNVMAMYNERNIGTNHLYNLSNWTMYGSSRLGIVFPPKDHVLYDTQFGNSWELPIEQMNVGLKRYEISNHLGNVLATITDRPVGVDSITTNESVEYFEPSLASASDYYPFGMLMPSRNIKSQVYPSGFNGQEKDDEIKGVGNSLEFKFRAYDSRIGRFISIDPLYKKYPWYTPFQFAGNTTIQAKDLEGLEPARQQLPSNTSKIPLSKIEQEKCSIFIPASSTINSKVQANQFILNDSPKNQNELNLISQRNVGKAVEAFGDIITFGSAALAPITGGATLPGVAIGSYISTVGTASQVEADIEEEKYGSAFQKVTIEAVSNGASSVLKNGVNKMALGKFDNSTKKLVGAQIDKVSVIGENATDLILDKYDSK